MKNRLFDVLIFLTLIIAGCEKESQEDFFNPDSKQEMTSSNDFHDFVQMVSYKKVANELDIKKILASVNADKNVTHKSSQPSFGTAPTGKWTCTSISPKSSREIWSSSLRLRT